MVAILGDRNCQVLRDVPDFGGKIMRNRLPFSLLVFFLLASLISPNLIGAKGGGR